MQGCHALHQTAYLFEVPVGGALKRHGSDKTGYHTSAQHLSYTNLLLDKFSLQLTTYKSIKVVATLPTFY